MKNGKVHQKLPELNQRLNEGLTELTRCSTVWQSYMQYWNTTDGYVQTVIAHAKEGAKNFFLMDGNELSRFNHAWEELRNVKADCTCKNEMCEEELKNFRDIIERGVKRVRQSSILQEYSDQDDQDPARTDEAYLKWKEWQERDTKQRKEKKKLLETKKMKEESWSLYKECKRLMEENREGWKSRKEDEQKRRAEQSRKDAITRRNVKAKTLK